MFANRSHVRYEFTNTKKLVKKLARIEASSICRTQFANVFADCSCAVHTYQLEFANTKFTNFSFQCEGRFSVPFVDAVVDGTTDSVDTVVVIGSFPLHLLVVQHTELQELIS